MQKRFQRQLFQQIIVLTLYLDLMYKYYSLVVSVQYQVPIIAEVLRIWLNGGLRLCAMVLLTKEFPEILERYKIPLQTQKVYFKTDPHYEIV